MSFDTAHGACLLVWQMDVDFCCFFSLVKNVDWSCLKASLLHFLPLYRSKKWVFGSHTEKDNIQIKARSWNLSHSTILLKYLLKSQPFMCHFKIQKMLFFARFSVCHSSLLRFCSIWLFITYISGVTARVECCHTRYVCNNNSLILDKSMRPYAVFIHGMNFIGILVKGHRLPFSAPVQWSFTFVPYPKKNICWEMPWVD